MKKGILIIISSLFFILVISDLLCILFNNKPLIYLSFNNYVYKGVSYDTYACPNQSALVKYKWQDYECDYEEEIEYSDEEYIKLESKLKEDSTKYAYDTYKSGRITISELNKLGYTELIYDPYNNKVCDGYSNIYYTDAGFVINSYIKCSNYTSEDYGK